MTAIISLMSLCLGAKLALHKSDQPEQAARFETLAGMALLVGLAMIGFGLRGIY